MSESKEVKGKAAAIPTGDSETIVAISTEAAATKMPADEPTGVKKLKKLLGGKDSEDGSTRQDTSSNSKPAGTKITPKIAETLLDMNPSLKSEMAGLDKDKKAEALRKMGIEELLTGLAIGGKNQKDMASYKFWQTQPVPRFDEQGNVTEGPIKIIDSEQVSKEPDPLLGGFEWTTLDLTDEKELQELWDLLTNHYVEDDNAMFRLRYTQSFLHWALMSPGWKNIWHVGVRATKSRKLVASICGVPAEIRVRNQMLKVAEINFLCIHKKLRSKRLAPVLIKEITRRCYLNGIYQAIYTAGVILPKPVSSCRYYHRPLDWVKLYEVGFSPLPPGSTKTRQVAKNHLPSETSTPGLRPMVPKDIDAVRNLLERYLRRFDLNQVFTKEEIDHWLVHKDNIKEQVVWSYVVEDTETHKITDFFSFYNLESTVIEHEKYKEVRAAYLYYYATESAFADNEKGLKERLLMLMTDALIVAKKARFDVFNALTLYDNPLFLEQLKFGAGDGQLHYYLYNYRTAPIAGGVNSRNLPDENQRGGVGIVML